jgi:hypothetical protein
VVIVVFILDRAEEIDDPLPLPALPLSTGDVLFERAADRFFGRLMPPGLAGLFHKAVVEVKAAVIVTSPRRVDPRSGRNHSSFTPRV